MTWEARETPITARKTASDLQDEHLRWIIYLRLYVLPHLEPEITHQLSYTAASVDSLGFLLKFYLSGPENNRHHSESTESFTGDFASFFYQQQTEISEDYKFSLSRF